MKRIAIIATVIFISLFISGAKAENECFKISQDGEVKHAKEIGSGYGISFTLPEFDSDEYYLTAVEIAVFQKGEADEHYSIYKDKKGNESKRKVINNPKSYNFQIEFGDIADYDKNTKYKLAYRYYATSIYDLSHTVIAGEDVKDGWRIVGEDNSIIPTDTGFSFYVNSAPGVSLTRVEYIVHQAEGDRPKRLGAGFLDSTILPGDAFTNGIKLIYGVSECDDEDTVSVTYTLLDAQTGSTISGGGIENAGKIYADVDCDTVNLVLRATDSFGAFSDSETYTITLDRTMPEVVSEFDDKGFYVKGLELFSDFEMNKDLQTVTAEICKGTEVISVLSLEQYTNGKYRLCETMSEDGEYFVKLYLEDFAGNMSAHTFTQKLDAQKPVCYVLTEEDDSSSTVYDEWTNESKKIIIDETDAASGIARHKLKLNSSLLLDERLDEVRNSNRFVWDVSESATGYLNYSVYVYDNAKTKNKTNNTVNTGGIGNYCIISKNVLIDKTNPVIAINHTDNRWYEAGYSVSAVFDDLPSKEGANDVSEIKGKYYAVLTRNVLPNEWSVYTGPIEFNTSGVYYIHFKAEDNAGNISISSARVRINSSAEILSAVTHVDSYLHTIFYSESGFYVVKNTAYNTKYHFKLLDKDISDKEKVSIKLVSLDDSDKYAEASVNSVSNGTQTRDVEFNLKYFDSEKTKLPDGVYEMLITITEIKESGEEITTIRDRKCCEVVIKRNSPPTPIITVSEG